MLFTLEKVDNSESVFRISGANSSRKRKKNTDEEFKEYLEKEQERNAEEDQDSQNEKENHDKENAKQSAMLAGLDFVDIRMKGVHKIGERNLLHRIIEKADNDDFSKNVKDNKTFPDHESEKSSDKSPAAEGEQNEEPDIEKHIDEIV